MPINPKKNTTYLNICFDSLNENTQIKQNLTHFLLCTIAQTKTCKNSNYYSTIIYNKWTINTFIITICPDKNKEIEFSVCLKSFLKDYNDNIKSHSSIIYATVK